MKNLKTTTINKVRTSLLNGEFKVKDLINETIDKINKQSPNYLNSFITYENSIENENLLKQIKESQDRYNNGANKRLDGLPIAVKDNFSTNGIKTTCASKMLSNYIPTFDSTVCKLLKDEGAIIIGKTNMDEFAMGSSSTTGYFGNVINPWSKKEKNEIYVAGGSSGGSAAALAAGYCLGAIGSDTGGSIRQPASYCGVFGFKPSYGLISRYGLVAYASSLDTPGVFTNNADDAAELLDILIKKDTEHDSTSISFNKDMLKEYKNKMATQSIKDLVFGIPTDYLVKELDPDILDLWKQVVYEIELHGGKVVPVELPNTRYALPAYYLLATSEASSNLSRYDGVRYGFRNENEGSDTIGLGLKDMYTKTRTEGFGEEVKKRIILGTMSLSRTQFDNFYIKAQKIRRLVSDDFKNVFKNQKVDVLITPTAPSPAFKQNERMDPIHVYINDIMTIPSNLTGVPAVSVPLKLSKNNLPIGIQLISDRLNDDTLLFSSNLIMNFDSFKNFNLKNPNYLI